MATLFQRANAFGELVRMKQKAFKVKTKQLSLIINNNRQIKSLKRVTFQFQTVSQLLKRLILINTKQLTIMLILSLISLILRLFCANINTFIVDQFQQQQSTSNLVYCIIFLIVYKLGKAFIDQLSSYLQMSYGFMGYSSLYYHFLKNKNHMTGEILNIVEDDMEKLSNLPYSLVNFPFLSILIVVLTVMLAQTMESNVLLIVFISLILYSANCVGGVCIFYLNEKLMKQKDYRLTLNLAENNDSQAIKQARKKQVIMTRTFLMVKVIVKWLTQFSFVLLYGFVFLWLTQQDQNDNQLYYRLMLLGMLKIAFNSLFMQSYYIALVLNSLKRILQCQHREQIEKSTIGSYEDFLKKNAQKNLLNNSDRQSTESSLSQQTSGSLRSSALRLTGESFEKSGDIKEMKAQHYNDGKQIKKNKKKYTERGEIKIIELGKYIKQNIQFILYTVSILLGLFTFYIKFQSLRISSSILHMKMGAFQYIVFFAPAILYTLFYLSIILIFVQVSKNLFKNLNAGEIQGQDLNRISGDIDMVDKYVPPSFYEFFITVFGLLASLVLTVSSIKDSFLAILTAILLLIIIWLCIYLNRYFMKSRRQLKRLQCKNKSSILQRYAQQNTEPSEQQVKFNKVEKNWKRINLLKNIGIVIENYYIFILNVLVLLIQILCFIVCFVGGIDHSTGKLILTFVLQLDLSLTGMLLNTINLQMGLVNFQRCLNFVKRIKANNKNTQENNKGNHHSE